MLEMLKNPTSPQTLAAVALFVGAVVRMLRTKTVSQLLDAAPPEWIKRIPKDYLPWIAVGIGPLLVFLDAHFNAGHTWLDSGLESIAGLLAGGTAVGGHETLGKAVGKVIYKPAGPLDPPPDDMEAKPTNAAPESPAEPPSPPAA